MRIYNVLVKRVFFLSLGEKRSGAAQGPRSGGCQNGEVTESTEGAR